MAEGGRSHGKGSYQGQGCRDLLWSFCLQSPPRLQKKKEMGSQNETHAAQKKLHFRGGGRTGRITVTATISPRRQRSSGPCGAPSGLTLAEGSGRRRGPAVPQEPGEDPPQPPAQQAGRRHLAGAGAAVTPLPPAGGRRCRRHFGARHPRSAPRRPAGRRCLF